VGTLTVLDYYQTVSQMSKIANAAGATATRAVATGVTAAAISKFVLKREETVSVLGMDMPEWGADGVLAGAYSATSDIAARYVAPPIERQFITNPKLVKFIEAGTAPVLTGLQQAYIKPMITGERPQRMNDFLLGTGSKFVGDQMVDSFWNA